MPQIDINWTAVIVAAVVNFVIGAVWYMPAVLGNAWMAELGKKKEDLGSPTNGMVLMAVSCLVTAYVLAHFVGYAQATTYMDGAKTGFWAWLGFLATSGLTGVGFEGRSWKLYFINQGYFLIGFAVMGAILAGWK